MNRSIKGFPGRYLVLLWLGIPFLFPTEAIMRLFGYPEEWYWWDIGYYIFSGIFLALVVVGIGLRYGVNFQRLFGSIPKRQQLKTITWLFVFLWFLSGAISFIVFYPLSLAFPDFVEWWYLDVPPVVYAKDDAILIVPNVLSIVSLVIFAPVVEEMIFRGYLLHRWTHKWGLTKAIVVSSAIFGVVHPDMVSATVFGIAMCLLYLQTQSLIAPILLHAMWNAAAWLWSLSEYLREGFDYRYTMEEFHGDVHYGFLYIAITAAFLFVYSNRPTRAYSWELPSV